MRRSSRPLASQRGKVTAPEDTTPGAQAQVTSHAGLQEFSFLESAHCVYDSLSTSWSHLYAIIWRPTCTDSDLDGEVSMSGLVL